MPENPNQSTMPQAAVEVTYAPARRPFKRRLVLMLRSWARRTFSRDSLLSSLKSLLWVAPLTILIWAYAEREQVVTIPNVTINVRAPGNDAGREIRLAPGSNSTIHAELRGPQAELERVKDWLESTTIPLEVDHNIVQGEHPIPIVDQLNRLQRVKDGGVTITNCMPDQVSVTVDPMVEKELDVVARPDDLRKMAGPPVFNPAKVKISAPKTVLDKAIAGAGGKLVAYANFDQSGAGLADPGTHDLIAVPLIPSVNMGDASVTLTPPVVSARVAVQRVDSRTVRVRVLPAYPDVPKTDQYKPHYDLYIPDVVVVGPEQELESLTSDVVAYFQPDYVTNFDNPSPAKLDYRLPPNVHTTGDAPLTIKYTFQRRNPSE